MIPRFSVASFFNEYFSRSNIWTFWVIFVSGILFYFLFDFLRWNQYDSHSYEAGARLLFNLDGGADLQGRMSKPLVLLIPGFCEFAFGIQSKYMFIVQSAFCYCFLIFLWKGILMNLKYSEDMQKLGTLLLILSQPIAVFSFGILTDFPGWCCMLGVIYVYTNKNSTQKWLLISIITLMGLLVKESIFIGIIFIIVSILLDKSIKVSKKVIYLSIFLLLIALSQIIILQFEYGSLIKRQRELLSWGWFFEQQKYAEVLQVWRAFDGTWWFVLLSLISFKREIKKVPYLFESIISLILCSIFLPLVHPASIVDRILFMFFPMVFLISLAYLQKFPFRISSLIVVLNGFLSIVTAFIIYKMEMKGTFLISFILSATFPTILIVYENRVLSTKNPNNLF